MKEFDYIIVGGGCAGLPLAYELDINQKLNDKTLAIVEPRTEYKREQNTRENRIQYKYRMHFERYIERYIIPC